MKSREGSIEHSSGIELIVRASVRGSFRRLFLKRSFVEEVERVLRAMERRGDGLAILITNNSEIRTLNFQFRRKRQATDVLSFPSGERRKGYLGDIVISLEKARLQARDYRIPLREEVLRLVVHGLLHLLGYEHEAVSQRKASLMARKERELHKLLELTPDLELKK